MNVESIKDTPIRKRSNKVQNSIEDILKEQSLNHELELQGEFYNKEKQKDISICESTTLRVEDKRVSTKNKFFSEDNKIVEYLFEEAIINILLKSIPLDESYLSNERNIEMIKENVKEVISDIQLKPYKETSFLWKNYFDKFSENIDNLKENAEDINKVASILESIEFNVISEQNVITEAIREKVLETINNEKYIASNREDLIKQNKKFDGFTMFGLINQKNLQELENRNIQNKPMEELVKESFAESVIDYTFFETLNVTKLYEFSFDNVNQMKSLLKK